MELIVALAKELAELIRAHAADDDEARHQAVIRLNRLTSDEIARRTL